MSTIRAIFLRDVKRILTNPVALIVTLGVCIIPSLYAWFNIAANFDPYANTSELPIAVINQDKGAKLDGFGEVNIGKQVVDSLAENKQLKWTFVNKEEGVSGVKAGTFYAAIEISPNFSEAIASPLTSTPQKPELLYYSNEKKNAIAPKVTDTGATTIEKEIDAQFSATVSEVVAQDAKKFLNNTSSTSELAQQTVSSRLKNVSKLLGDLNDQLASSTDTLTSIHKQLADTQKLTHKLPDSLDSTGDLLTSTDKLVEKTQTHLLGSISGITDTTTDLLQTTEASSADVYQTIAQLIGKLSIAKSKIDEQYTKLQDIVDAQNTLQKDLQRLVDRLPSDSTLRLKLTDKLNQIASVIASEQDTLSTLKLKGELMQKSIDQLAKLNDDTYLSTSDLVKQVLDIQKQINSEILPAAQSAMSDVSNHSQKLSGILIGFTPLVKQAQNTLEGLSQNTQTAQDVLATTKAHIESIKQDVDQLTGDLLNVALADELKQLGSKISPDMIKDFMENPVVIQDKVIYPVANYGSGVAPFYTNLALWVGGFVLVAIFKLEVDDEGIGAYKPYQGYFGRVLFLVVLGLLQAVICCVGDLVLGIQYVNATAFILTGLVCSFVYVNCIYALSIAFKHIGKALAVLLVILQIPGSNGMYPIEMMPQFFQKLYPWLPFTYGINAMRETISGFYGSIYLHNIVMLLAFMIPALVIGIGLRRHLLNINALFDKKLAETDMMISERIALKRNHFKLKTLLKAALHSEEYAHVLKSRSHRFEKLYHHLMRWGLIALIVIPMLLTGLLFVMDAKFIMMMIWIGSIVAICAYLIVVEYIHETVTRKMELSTLSHDELVELLDSEMQHEMLAFAPIEQITNTQKDGDVHA